LLENLTSKILLGEELLDSIGAFEAHIDSFIDLPDFSEEDSLGEFNLMKWANPAERYA
jgi:hypothetical protein